MTLLTARPRPATPSDAEVLFKEARQRRRRRRILATAIVAAVAALSTTVVALTRGGSAHAQAPTAPKPSASLASLPETPPRVAWVDYSDRVHIGSLKTGEERVVAEGPEASNSATTQMVTSGKLLFWDTGGGVFYDKTTRRAQSFASTVMAYDTITGRTRSFAPGMQVLNTVGSTDVLVLSDDASHLSRYNLNGQIVSRLTLPHGWYLPDVFGLGSSPALANGAILVQSQTPVQATSAGAKPTQLAVWTPASGHIDVLGEMSSMVATHTDGRDSLVAWLPASCPTNQNCLLQLRNLASGKTLQIQSPYGFGFDMRGAFSPDGKQLAAFTRTNSGGYNPQTRLALIDVTTGRLRPVLGATIAIGEGVGWAQWLPGSQLISGGMCAASAAATDCFHTDSATLHTVPQRLGARDDQELNNSTGVSYPTNANYSTVVLP